MGASSILVLVVLLSTFLVKSLHVLQEQERVAVFLLGKFKCLKGPGVLMQMLGVAECWYRISLGMRGELVSNDTASFKVKSQNVMLPVTGDSSIRIGKVVRITGFKENKVVVVFDSDQTRVVSCEKCGHEMKI